MTSINKDTSGTGLEFHTGRTFGGGGGGGENFRKVGAHVLSDYFAGENAVMAKLHPVVILGDVHVGIHYHASPVFIGDNNGVFKILICQLHNGAEAFAGKAAEYAGGESGKAAVIVGHKAVAKEHQNLCEVCASGEYDKVNVGSGCPIFWGQDAAYIDEVSGQNLGEGVHAANIKGVVIIFLVRFIGNYGVEAEVGCALNAIYG